MITRHKYKDIDWVELDSPTEDEILPIAEEFGLNPLVADELRGPSERSRADLHGKYVYMIFHLPRYRHGEGRGPSIEIDFIVGKDFIITSHYEPIDLFLAISKKLETKSILDKFASVDNAGMIFYLIMRSLYEGLGHDLEHIRKDLTLAEKEIFAGNEDRMVHALSKINKVLIDFRHPLKIHQEILGSFETKEKRLFDNPNQHYAEMIMGEYRKIWNRLENNRDLLMDLRDTNDSLFSAKTNNIMKNLTIMSFLTFPLSLITSIFSMNTSRTPLAEMENGFWIIVGAMAIMTAIILSLFRYKRWIS